MTIPSYWTIPRRMLTKQETSFKYEEIRESLRARIASMASGSRLPSVRSLMKKYEASLQTINSALQRLEEENLIVSRRGSGIYVSDNRKVRFIMYHRPLHPSRNGDSKEVSLTKAAKAEGWHLAVRRHHITDDGQEMHSEPLACAHIINSDLANNRLSFFNQIMQQKVPTLLLGREAGIFDVDYVTGNDRQILIALVKHMKELGHRQFGFLVNEPLFFEVVQRKENLVEILEMFDLPPAVFIECETPSGGSSLIYAYNTFSQFLKEHQKKLPFTALLSASPTGGPAVIRAFHEMGFQIPRDCSIATFGSEPENAFCIPSLTECGLDVAQWGQWAIQLLKKRFDGDKSPPLGMKLPVHLSVRESTGKVGSEKPLSLSIA